MTGPELLDAETHGEMQLPQSCFMSTCHLSPVSFGLHISDNHSSENTAFMNEISP